MCYYSWPDCLVGSTQGCPCPCFLQIIRRLKQACFLIRLKKKKNPSNFHPWKRSMEISPVVRLSCCPSEPPRGLAEIPDVRMFSEQLVKFDPKQSRAKKKKKKKGPGKSGHSPQGFHVPREQALPPLSGLPVPALGIMWAATQGLWFWRFLSMAA